jgi:hypothetical protein
MKKKQKLFLGFVVLIITTIITLAGCDLLLGPTFPSEFNGNWVREYGTTTLIINLDIIKVGSGDSWELTSISGDYYFIRDKDGREAKLQMVLENGILTLDIDSNAKGYELWWWYEGSRWIKQ